MTFASERMPMRSSSLGVGSTVRESGISNLDDLRDLLGCQLAAPLHRKLGRTVKAGQTQLGSRRRSGPFIRSLSRSLWRSKPAINCVNDSFTQQRGETVWQIAGGSESCVIYSATRRQGRFSPRFADSWNPTVEPIRIYQSALGEGFPEVCQEGAPGSNRWHYPYLRVGPHAAGPTMRPKCSIRAAEGSVQILVYGPAQGELGKIWKGMKTMQRRTAPDYRSRLALWRPPQAILLRNANRTKGNALNAPG
jgi:hypothetical protein